MGIYLIINSLFREETLLKKDVRGEDRPSRKGGRAPGKPHHSESCHLKHDTKVFFDSCSRKGGVSRKRYAKGSQFGDPARWSERRFNTEERVRC